MDIIPLRNDIGRSYDGLVARATVSMISQLFVWVGCSCVRLRVLMSQSSHHR